MDIQTFIRKNQDSWKELEQLILLFERRGPASAEQIDRLIALYRKTSAHLAYAQTYYPHDKISVFLNDLVGRAHHVVFAEPSKRMHRVAAFFRAVFVGLLLERRWFVLAAMFIFIMGGVAGFLAVHSDPLNLYTVIPEPIAHAVDPERTGQHHDEWLNAVASAEIMTNNIRVAALAFVGGITFGLLTVYMLLYNGILIGALFAVFLNADRGYVFWAYILPHGIIELAAIFIAGGAGLYMGYRMICPGRYSRKYQFIRSVRESALLLLGTIPMFVIAAVIEGYVTPSSLSLGAKYMFALFTLVALCVYLIYGKMNWTGSRTNHSA